MKKLIVIGSLILLGSGLSSCDRDRHPHPGYTPQQYSFVEDFVDDRNGWGFADPVNYAYGVVSNGTFKFDYNDDYSVSYYVAQYVGFNTDDDFTISARIGSNNNMGLLFGYDDVTGAYGYSFTVDVDGYFALYDEGNNGYGGDIVELVPLQTRNFVNYNGDWNDLTVEQRGGRWIGYINDYQVFDIQAQNFRGNGIGFVVDAFTQGEADYIEAFWWE